MEREIFVAHHRLHEYEMFSDESLIRLIDEHPAECFHVNTMGYTHDNFEWREGDRAGVPGEVLLDLVRRGRLWLNLRNVMIHHREYRDLINELYAELETRCPGFHAQDRSANLLISSPGALVHYHLDIPVNMLWHIRGAKRVWVYPPFDDRVVDQEVLEAVCSGEYAEDIPYDESFDEYAQVFDLQPGEMVTWPQHTPHRVTNLESLNVSLSTEHKNPAAVRRINVHLANRLLRTTLGIPCRSTDNDGPMAHLKQAFIRTVRRFRKLRGQKHKQFNYPVSFRVDPDAPNGVGELHHAQQREAVAM